MLAAGSRRFFRSILSGNTLVRGFSNQVVINVPSMGDSISEGTLIEWTKDIGEFAHTDDAVAVIETDKVSIDVKASIDGKVTQHLAEIDSVVTVGSPLFKMEASEAPPSAIQKAPEPVKAEAPKPVAETPKPQQPEKEIQQPKNDTERVDTRVKLSPLRLRTAERLKDAQNTAALLTTFQECDMGNLIELRNEFKDEFEKENGIKLGMMSAFVKASTIALQKVPAVNGMIDEATKEIVYHDYVDISVAVAAPKGLVVPVIRNCEKLSFAEIEQTIGSLGQKAREGSLALEDMAGGTFTISNGGIWGSLLSTPILNSPQAAVLGMHGIQMRPVVGQDGKIVPRPMMYLALTYDHRIIDGREAVTFLKSVADKIADPRRLLLSL